MYDETAKEQAYATKERESLLPIVEQDKALKELHEYLNVLEDLLRPVLTPVSEKEATMGTDEPSKPVSPLASKLKNNNQEIYNATNKVRMMINRVEC